MPSRAIDWLSSKWPTGGRAVVVGMMLCLSLAPGASGPRGAGQAALATRDLAAIAPAPSGEIVCPPSYGGAPDFLTCQYAGAGSARMTFYLYPPRNYDPSQRYPLVLVLHGVGESAQPNLSAEQNRAVLLTNEYAAVWGPGFPTGGPSVQDRWPCFVVVPQVVSPNRWVNVLSSQGSYHLLAQPSQSLLMAVEIVELLQAQYTGIDVDRLYVTGLSMGAFGVYDAIERWPSLFAAAVPLAGAGDPAFAARIAQLPLWDFHGARDTLVPVQGSRAMIAAVRAAGGHPCYTELAGMDHGIWGQVYGLAQNLANPLYPWLFAQRKGSGSSSSPGCDAGPG